MVETCENHLLHYPTINGVKQNSCGSIAQPSDLSDLEVCGNKLGRYLKEVDACTEGLTKEHQCMSKDELTLETCHDILEYENVSLFSTIFFYFFAVINHAVGVIQRQ